MTKYSKTRTDSVIKIEQPKVSVVLFSDDQDRQLYCLCSLIEKMKGFKGEAERFC